MEDDDGHVWSSLNDCYDVRCFYGQAGSSHALTNQIPFLGRLGSTANDKFLSSTSTMAQRSGLLDVLERREAVLQSTERAALPAMVAHLKIAAQIWLLRQEINDTNHPLPAGAWQPIFPLLMPAIQYANTNLGLDQKLWLVPGQLPDIAPRATLEEDRQNLLGPALRQFTLIDHAGMDVLWVICRLLVMKRAIAELLADTFTTERLANLPVTRQALANLHTMIDYELDGHQRLGERLSGLREWPEEDEEATESDSSD